LNAPQSHLPPPTALLKKRPEEKKFKSGKEINENNFTKPRWSSLSKTNPKVKAKRWA
jgi:hypothetical protein